MNVRNTLRVLLTAGGLSLALATGAHAGAITIGPGSLPGVYVEQDGSPQYNGEPKGTAYIAWVGPENPTTLRFCRLPRGAVACDAAAASSIAAPGTSGSRPFVVGDPQGYGVAQVFQFRYGAGVPGFGALYRFYSNAGVTSFGEGQVVGDVPFFEAVFGPGYTLSGVTHAGGAGALFQNVLWAGPAPVDPNDGSSTVGEASLSGDHDILGTVGLVNDTTPLAVFTDASDNAQFHRYSGSGNLNDEANWTTPPTNLGHVYAPKLAGGPSGLFLLGLGPENDVIVRKYDGVTFGAPVMLGAKGQGPNHHLFQDSLGRLHSISSRADGAGLHLVHAVSDDGVAWRSGDVLTQNPATDGGISDPRIATAPDHIGVAVWQADTPREIRVATVGPDAPFAPGPVGPGSVAAATLPAKPPATARRVRGGKVKLKIKGKLALPAGVAAAQACTGKLTATVKRGRKRIARRKLKLSATCAFKARLTLARKKAKKAKRLTLVLSFPGNATLGPVKRSYRIKIKAR